MEDIVKRNEATGGRWFSPSNIAYHKPRLCGVPRTLPTGDIAWVESVRGYTGRRWVLVVMEPDGSISPVDYELPNRATALRKLARMTGAEQEADRATRAADLAKWENENGERLYNATKALAPTFWTDLYRNARKEGFEADDMLAWWRAPVDYSALLHYAGSEAIIRALRAEHESYGGR
jgi:hypothetical protein